LKEAEELFKSAWVPAIAGKEFLAAINYLQNYVIPMPTSVNNLFIALGSLLGQETSLYRDVCGDASWEQIKKILLPSLVDSMRKFQSAGVVNVALPENRTNAVKAFCEANTVFDASIYPSNIPVFSVLVAWLQKAITAREAAITFFAEVKKTQLEISE